MSWLNKWKFLSKTDDWIGKTITRVETLGMSYGCTHSHCTLLQFSDGSRGWILGSSSQHTLPSPRFEEMQKSMIIRPEELGEVAAHMLREKQRAEDQARQQKIDQLRRLEKELGRQ